MEFMCPVITDISSAVIVEYTQDAIPLTHLLKRQSQFHNPRMCIFQPGISNCVLGAYIIDSTLKWR